MSFGRVHATLACVSILSVSCRDVMPERQVPPHAEFLFAAGDSTWWVRSSPDGMRVRSAPILITLTDGKFYEVFVSEQGEEYEDATLASAQVYARDVLRQDSVVIFDDPTALREIARWKRANPNAIPLDADEELDAEEPTTAITDEIEIIDVHGAFVTVQHSLDIDVAGRPGHRHNRRRSVVDVRSGRRATLATLFGAAAGADAARRGRGALQQLKDSIAVTGDERAGRARSTLQSFRFDVSSFTITDSARLPAVSFMVPGNDADGSAIAINLPPLLMPVQPWWSEVQHTLPQWTPDSMALEWRHPLYSVRATPVGDGSLLSLVLVETRDSSRIDAQGRAPREWEVATVIAPAYQLIALDNHPLSTQLRSALSRAFDAASTVDGIGQRVNRTNVARKKPTVRTVSFNARVTAPR